MHEWKTFDYRETTDNERITWIFQDFIPVAKLQGDKSYSIISDHIGTPLVAIDNEGVKVWERELDIYGKVRKLQGDKWFMPFLYQGQYYDVETELAYNRFRYYSPDTGAYISQDPIGLSGENPTIYGYVEDINVWLDIFGLACHHIATNKHREWSEKFRDLFKQYGIGKFKNGKWRKEVLNDPRNKVEVDEHKGPHNEEGFHENIYRRLKEAGEKEGAVGFEAELAKMKIECVTKGSDMNKIITKTY